MEEVIRRFNDIRWHDSKLLCFSLSRSDSSEQVTLSLMLRNEQGEFVATEAVFLQSTYVNMDVDLEGKRVCADDISSGQCYASSEWTKSLAERNPYDNFAGYL